MKGLRALYVAVLCLFATAPVFAQRTTHVNGYYRSNGTYVAPYDRRAPSAVTPAPAPTPPTIVVPEPKVRTTRSGSVKAPAVQSTATPRIPARGPNGRFVRSSSARHQFMESTGYPNGRPGYVVDHRIPLACGGADSPSNMQWQSVADGKAKDRTERSGCTSNHR